MVFHQLKNGEVESILSFLEIQVQNISAGVLFTFVLAAWLCIEGLPPSLCTEETFFGPGWIDYIHFGAALLLFLH